MKHLLVIGSASLTSTIRFVCRSLPVEVVGEVNSTDALRQLMDPHGELPCLVFVDLACAPTPSHHILARCYAHLVPVPFVVLWRDHLAAIDLVWVGMTKAHLLSAPCTPAQILAVVSATCPDADGPRLDSGGRKEG